MFNVINADTSDYNFFPSGSFDSRKDSAELSELLEYKDKHKSFSLSMSEDTYMNNSSQFIAYEEMSPIICKNFNIKEEKPIKGTLKHKNPLKRLESIQELVIIHRHSLSENSAIKKSELPHIKRIENLKNELFKTDKENALLKVQLKYSKETIDYYEQSMKTIKNILEGIKLLDLNSIKCIPSFDIADVKTLRQSLDTISMFISSVLTVKSAKSSCIKDESKRIKCLKLDDVYPSILIPDSPEPPKANLIKRQNSNIHRHEKNNHKEIFIDKKNHLITKINPYDSLLAIQPKNFKSVSPILKSKYKPLIHRK